MRRILGFVVALAGLLAAGAILWRAPPVTTPAAALAVPAADDGGQAAEAPAAPIEVLRAPMSEADREARRLARYDKDDNGAVSRSEFLANRQKAFAKADRNRDGRLDFEEFAVATATKFARADRDGDGRLGPKEFATTAVKRKPKAACVCAAADAE